MGYRPRSACNGRASAPWPAHRLRQPSRWFPANPCRGGHTPHSSPPTAATPSAAPVAHDVASPRARRPSAPAPPDSGRPKAKGRTGDCLDLAPGKARKSSEIALVVWHVCPLLDPGKPENRVAISAALPAIVQRAVFACPGAAYAQRRCSLRGCEHRRGRPNRAARMSWRGRSTLPSPLLGSLISSHRSAAAPSGTPLVSARRDDRPHRDDRSPRGDRRGTAGGMGRAGGAGCIGGAACPGPGHRAPAAAPSGPISGCRGGGSNIAGAPAAAAATMPSPPSHGAPPPATPGQQIGPAPHGIAPPRDPQTGPQRWRPASPAYTTAACTPCAASMAPAQTSTM